MFFSQVVLTISLYSLVILRFDSSSPHPGPHIKKKERKERKWIKGLSILLHPFLSLVIKELKTVPSDLSFGMCIALWKSLIIEWDNVHFSYYFVYLLHWCFHLCYHCTIYFIHMWHLQSAKWSLSDQSFCDSVLDHIWPFICKLLCYFTFSYNLLRINADLMLML